MIKYLFVFILGGVFFVLGTIFLGTYNENGIGLPETDEFAPLFDAEMIEESIKDSYCRADYGTDILVPLKSIAALYSTMIDNPVLGDTVDFNLYVTHARLAKVYNRLGSGKKSERSSMLATAYHQIYFKGSSNLSPKDVIDYVDEIDQGYCSVK